MLVNFFFAKQNRSSLSCVAGSPIIPEVESSALRVCIWVSEDTFFFELPHEAKFSLDILDSLLGMQIRIPIHEFAEIQNRIHVEFGSAIGCAGWWIIFWPLSSLPITELYPGRVDLSATVHIEPARSEILSTLLSNTFLLNFQLIQVSWHQRSSELGFSHIPP